MGVGNITRANLVPTSTHVSDVTGSTAELSAIVIVEDLLDAEAAVVLLPAIQAVRFQDFTNDSSCLILLQGM